MHSTADLRCIHCHVNHITWDGPNQNTRFVVLTLLSQYPIIAAMAKYHYLEGPAAAASLLLLSLS